MYCQIELMKKKFMITLVIFAMMMLCVMGNARGDETEKIVCEVESPVDGISGSFGFTMAYPDDATILEDTTIDLSYSPSPEDATIFIDTVKLLQKYKPYSGLKETVKIVLRRGDIDSWDDLPDELKNLKLPVNDTPLGTYVIVSEIIYDATVAQLVLDVEINSQINTTLETTGGSLSGNYFEWHNWGAEEVTLTPSATDEYIEVSALFEYYVNLEFTLSLNYWKLAGLSIEKQKEPLFTKHIPLKEMPFPNTVTSKIIIDKSHTRIKELEAELSVANINIESLEADLSKANGDIDALESSLTKANKDIKELRDTIGDLNAANMNLTQDLKESTELILDKSDTTVGLMGGPDYSIVFIGVGILISLVIGIFVYMISKKKKRESQPYRVPPRAPMPYPIIQKPKRENPPPPKPIPPVGVANFFMWEDNFEKPEIQFKDEVRWEDDYFDEEWEFIEDKNIIIKN